MERVETRRPSNRPVDAWWPVVQIDRSACDQTGAMSLHRSVSTVCVCVRVWPLSAATGLALVPTGSSRIRTSRTSLATVESMRLLRSLLLCASLPRRLADSQGLPLPGWVPLAAPNIQSLNIKLHRHTYKLLLHTPGALGHTPLLHPPHSSPSFAPIRQRAELLSIASCCVARPPLPSLDDEFATLSRRSVPQ
ncbi:hypothetical protein MAJ_00646, partial [Metarhizium majus ARSEF 297]